MLGYHRFLFSFCNTIMESRYLFPSTRVSLHRLNSTSNEDAKLHVFLNYMEQLKNYERIGVPKDAGTDSDDGFDLGRMRRLLQRLGNPHFRFKVFTALAFALFSQQGVDVAVIEAGLGGARDATNVLRSAELAASVITSVGEEHLSALGGSLESIALAKSGIIKPGRPVVIGGPLQPHIEHIFRNKASLLNSPLVSAYLAGTKSNIRFFGKEEIPYQCCEIHINIEEAMPLLLNLADVKLQMLGKHQLQNAITATCIALCLQNNGWMISNQAIRTGLEKTCLPGRGQYLTKKEAEILGLTRVSILIDGAHTEASAKGLTDLIALQNPDGVLALVVSMASDKDHMAFAMQLLTGRRPDVVILTETSVAGSQFRSTSALSLKDTWLRAAMCLGINALDLGTMSHWKKADELANNEQVLLMCNPNAKVGDCLQLADELLRLRTGERPHFIVVTGSLHIVSSVLALLQH